MADDTLRDGAARQRQLETLEKLSQRFGQSLSTALATGTKGGQELDSVLGSIGTRLATSLGNKGVSSLRPKGSATLSGRRPPRAGPGRSAASRLGRTAPGVSMRPSPVLSSSSLTRVCSISTPPRNGSRSAPLPAPSRTWLCSASAPRPMQPTRSRPSSTRRSGLPKARPRVARATCATRSTRMRLRTCSRCCSRRDLRRGPSLA